MTAKKVTSINMNLRKQNLFTIMPVIIKFFAGDLVERKLKLKEHKHNYKLNLVTVSIFLLQSMNEKPVMRFLRNESVENKFTNFSLLLS